MDGGQKGGDDDDDEEGGRHGRGGVFLSFIVNAVTICILFGGDCYIVPEFTQCALLLLYVLSHQLGHTQTLYHYRLLIHILFYIN